MATSNVETETSSFSELSISNTEGKCSFYPLRMTSDHKTEKYVKFAKVLIIFQGSVTKERSQAVSELTSKFKYAVFEISDKTYQKANPFVPFSIFHGIEDFYNYCKDRAKKSFEDDYSLIVIDQSLTNRFLLKYYCALAHKMQYVILPYPPVVQRYLKDDVRSTQASKFEHFAEVRVERPNFFNHLFCGWFLHDIDSIELRSEASWYVQDCYKVLEFREMFSNICKSQDFKELYNMLDKRQDLAFCVTKIFQNALADRSYMLSNEFMKHYGSMSKLYVVGFIISPHIIAARVKLTHDQRKLWEMPDVLNNKDNPTVFPSKLLQNSKIDLPNTDSVNLITSHNRRTIIPGNPIYEPTKVFHPRAVARSCHIVLGKVKDAPLLNCDYDVPLAVTREMNAVPKYPDELRPYDLDRCLLRRIGKFWYIYLKETIVVNGFFATCCALDDKA